MRHFLSYFHTLCIPKYEMCETLLMQGIENVKRISELHDQC